jgi:hypothetical protein
MRKAVIAKGNMRRADFMRAVVTDTLPEEVPIIFSNDGFYLNLNGARVLSDDVSDFVEALVVSDRRYTIPYRYRVVKDQASTRGLSLLHPAAQYKVARFYQKHDSLICYYTKKSDLSLRTPYKVGSTYFIRGTNTAKNTRKSSDIDTVSIEKSVSNPASYFSYSHIRRAHQFFDSTEYLRLEKKFSIFRSLDVSKCFNSIYTHTMFWAVSTIDIAKNNTTASSFGNEFDRLMQFMNYNETNGICIGPECCRVFAEIILSRVDQNIIAKLSIMEIYNRSDFEIRRYIDDFYVFAKDVETADTIQGVITACLAEYNLHLNERKTETMQRPFATKKSQAISDTDSALNALFDLFIDEISKDGKNYTFPVKINRANSIIRQFTKNIKNICVSHNASYEMVSDYVISALNKRVVSISDDISHISKEKVDIESYISAIMLLVELAYFFYTVNPTVRSSLNIARSIVTANSFFKENALDRRDFFSETVVRWTIELSRSISNGVHHRKLTAVPVEVLNVIIPLAEIAENEPIVDALVEALCQQIDHFGYFEIVTFLFLAKGKHFHRERTNDLFKRAKLLICDSNGIFIDSQAAHLCLDLLSCPYLPLDKRGSWYNNLRGAVGLQKLTKADAQAAAAHFESNPWFINWSGINLMNILKKKELSIVY